MAKTSWEVTRSGRCHYVDVHAKHVIVGSHCGTGQSDNAGRCTHEQFLDGRFQDIVEREHGTDVLDEVIQAVKACL